MSRISQYTSGPRPDITPPQIVAIVTAGIPILASLLSAFGIYNLSLDQQQAMNDAVTWSAVLAAALIGGDAALRTGRNYRKAKVESVLAEGGEDLEIVHDVMAEQAAAVTTIPPVGHQQGGDLTTYQSTSEDETVVMGFEEPPPKPLPSPPVRRRRKKG